MARQSRQARRAQDRRLHHERRHQQQKLQFGWQAIAGTALVVAVAALLGFKAFTSNGPGSSTPTTNAVQIGGVVCDQGMTQSNVYHIHAHLSILIAGKPFTIGKDSGHYYDKDCLFWTHAHDDIGIIHVEAPQRIVPTLNTWFGVLAKTNPGGVPNIVPGAGQTRKVWVNMKPYTGDPRKIPIYQHTDITIEIGPPFSAPTPFNFKAHGV